MIPKLTITIALVWLALTVCGITGWCADAMQAQYGKIENVPPLILMPVILGLTAFVLAVTAPIGYALLDIWELWR